MVCESADLSGATTSKTRHELMSVPLQLETQRYAEPADAIERSPRTLEIENDAQGFIRRLTNPISLMSRKRVDENHISQVFAELDVDNSGTLSQDEFSAFVVGRFGMTKKSLSRIFDNYDRNHNSTIDMAEFVGFIKDLNEAALRFDKTEEEYEDKIRLKIHACACFTYCCSLCTLCTSCYCGTKAMLVMSKTYLDRKVSLLLHIPRRESALTSLFCRRVPRSASIRAS